MKKVAIVGFGPSWKEAPFHDPSYEIWGLNDLYGKIPRWDKWFDLHDWDSKDPNSIKTFVGKRTEKTKLSAYVQMDCPIYCQEAWPALPTAVKFPLKEIQDKFCNGEKGYFTNQISYMIAFALYEDYDIIEIYGVDMTVDTEYGIQRPSAEYWMGIAKGMGKEIYVPQGSTLLKSPFIYGYEQEEKMAFIEIMKTRLQRAIELRQEATKKQTDLNNQLTTVNAAINQYAAVESFIRTQLKEWGSDAWVQK